LEITDHFRNINRGEVQIQNILNKAKLVSLMSLERLIIQMSKRISRIKVLVTVICLPKGNLIYLILSLDLLDLLPKMEMEEGVSQT